MRGLCSPLHSEHGQCERDEDDLSEPKLGRSGYKPPTTLGHPTDGQWSHRISRVEGLAWTPSPFGEVAEKVTDGGDDELVLKKTEKK